jgi:hypothetical protein
MDSWFLNNKSGPKADPFETWKSECDHDIGQEWMTIVMSRSWVGLFLKRPSGSQALFFRIGCPDESSPSISKTITGILEMVISISELEHLIRNCTSTSWTNRSDFLKVLDADELQCPNGRLSPTAGWPSRFARRRDVNQRVIWPQPGTGSPQSWPFVQAFEMQDHQTLMLGRGWQFYDNPRLEVRKSNTSRMTIFCWEFHIAWHMRNIRRS